MCTDSVGGIVRKITIPFHVVTQRRNLEKEVKAKVVIGRTNKEPAVDGRWWCGSKRDNNPTLHPSHGKIMKRKPRQRSLLNRSTYC